MLCIATGSSPTEAYRLLAEEFQKTPELFEQIRIVQLDEWKGLGDRMHPSSCEAYIRQKLIGPLSVSEERYIAFNGCAVDGEAECARVSQALEEWGGIDIAVLGLGLNGHLGFNEPQSRVRTAHVAQLSAASQTHTMIAEQGVVCTEGLTLGLDQIFESKSVLLIVTGSHKAPVPILVVWPERHPYYRDSHPIQ